MYDARNLSFLRCITIYYIITFMSIVFYDNRLLEHEKSANNTSFRLSYWRAWGAPGCVLPQYPGAHPVRSFSDPFIHTTDSSRSDVLLRTTTRAMELDAHAPTILPHQLRGDPVITTVDNVEVVVVLVNSV